jgi:hypothetical protein
LPACWLPSWLGGESQNGQATGSTQLAIFHLLSVSQLNFAQSAAGGGWEIGHEGSQQQQQQPSAQHWCREWHKVRHKLWNKIRPKKHLHKL